MDNLNDSWQERYKTLEKQFCELQKSYDVKENEHKKEMALLNQQLDIQLLEIRECKQRETNLKKMNETFLMTMDENKSQSQSRLLKDFQRSIETTSIESKNRLQEQIVKLDARIKELDAQHHEKELTLKDMENHYEKQIMHLQNMLVEAKSREDIQETKLQKLQADAKYRKDLNQFEYAAQIKELQQQLINLKIEHKKEIDKLKQNHDNEIKKAKNQYAIKRSTSVDESAKTPTQRPKQLMEMETKYKEEKKKLKSQVISYEVSMRQYKEKIERLTKQVGEFESLQHEMRVLQNQLQNLIRENNSLSQRLNEKHDLESNLKGQIVELTTLLEEERLINERLRLQETASLGFKFGDFDSKQKEIQSPCHPTARVRQITNNRQPDYSQLTLNPQDRIPHQSSNKIQDKENSQPDVSHFNTNAASFKVQDLIQNASIGDSIELKENNNIGNIREKELQTQLQKMLSKLYQAKKLITTSTNEESTYIRSSVQKIRSRSRNHSISVNEQLSEFLDESKCPQFQLQSFLDDSMEIRRPSQNTVNSFSICQFDDNQPSRLKLKQQSTPLHPYYQQARYQQPKILQMDSSYQN